MQHTDYPPTRAEARAKNLNRYFTGKPCSKGHTALRFLTGTCVECGKIAVKSWEKRNPGKSKARMVRYYEANKDKVKANGLKSKRKAMGIPEAPVPNPGICAICDRKGRPMHLDHCHATGAFRGWLCHTCNLALGHLGDNISGLEKAIAYLRSAL